jgi:hypothetical protein
MEVSEKPAAMIVKKILFIKEDLVLKMISGIL